MNMRFRRSVTWGQRTACLVGGLALLLVQPLPGALAGPFNVVTFSPWSGYAIPNGVWLTGDFNGDGRADIFHAVANRDYAHMWSSNGSGAFTVSTFRPWAGYAIPNGLWLTGDFNGDRRTDIFHAVQGRDYAHVWLSTGGGNFAVTTFRPWAGYAIPNGLWLATDLNGDGRTDIVHAVQGRDYVHTWLANVGGGFTVGTFRPWAGYAIPNGLWLTGDLNADGRGDIIHAVQGRDYVHTWISNGSGGFTVGTFRPWAGYAIPNGLWLTADINADGRTDIVHAVQGRDYVHTWISDGSGGFSVGTFRPWAGYAIPNGVWLAGDFDADGRVDLFHAVQGTDYAHVWLSDGTGRFNVLTYSPWGGYAIPNGLWLTADVTGDRRMDVVHAVQSRDYIHPWISTLPRVGQVSLDGLEVTQTIQEMRHTVPLVAGKTTFARAYLNVQAPAPITARGVLTGRRGAGLPMILNSANTVTINPGENWRLRTKREDVNRSLMFELPASWVGAGNLQVRLSAVTETSGASRVCSDCATSPVSVTLQTSAPLRVRVIGLRYATGTPPTSFAPRALDFNLTRSWLRRVYPAPAVNMTQTTVNATNAWPFGCGQANGQIASIRALDVASGTDRRTHYYGLVHDGGGFMRGCAASIPGTPDPAAVASGPTGAGTFGWDSDGSYGDWYTGHELAHTLGRLHPGSGCGESSDDANEPFTNGQISGNDGAYVGFDVGDAGNGIARAALPGTVWRDVMTYCTNQWVSHYTYGGIRTRLTGEDVLPAGAPAPGFGADFGVSPAGVAPRVRPALAAPPKVVTGVRPQEVIEDGEMATAPAAAGTEPDEASLPAGGEAPADAPEPAYSEPPEVHTGPVDATRPAVKGLTLAAGPEVKLQTGDLVSVVATVNITRRTGELVSVSRVKQGILSPAVESQEAQIRFLNIRGKVLKAFAAPLRRDSDIPPDEDQTGLVDVVVPFVKGAANIEVMALGQVIATRAIPKSAPSLRITGTPDVDAMGVARGMPAISWTASSAAGAELSYAVQASLDGGKTWQTVAYGLKETRYEVDPEEFPGAKSVLFRVIANDGVNNTVVTSKAVKLR